MDFVRRWSEKTEIGAGRFIGWLDNRNHPGEGQGKVPGKDMLAGRQQEIHAERDRKLEGARQQRRSRRKRPA